MKLITEIVSASEMQNGKEKKKEHEKRLGIERRRFSYTYLIPERRNIDRGDRRKNRDPRKQKEKNIEKLCKY